MKNEKPKNTNKEAMGRETLSLQLRGILIFFPGGVFGGTGAPTASGSTSKRPIIMKYFQL
jgi:hypothetical protein